jgi:hypothetical protein
MTARPSQPAPRADVAEGEPVFEIAAGDFMAPEFVEKYAAALEEWGAEASAVRAARACAKRMNDWRIKHGMVGR